MVYNKDTYDKIHQLLERKLPHREVAKQCGVNKNTVTALINRKTVTQSIYPSRLNYQPITITGNTPHLRFDII